MDTTITYRVIRRRHGTGSESTIAEGASSLAEAAEIAFKLTRLQEDEIGGTDQFIAQPE